jgi:parallel beta-helix repeat protein
MVNATLVIAVVGSIAAASVELGAQAPSTPRSVRVVSGGGVVVNGLSISGPASVNVGQTAQYTIQASYTNGGKSFVINGAVWSTSNSGLATVTQSGVLTALATGTVTVQATYEGLTAQFATTLASTTASSAYGPQATITCPAGAVNISPGQSIQNNVNLYPGATTFCLRAGVHYLTSAITPKTGNTFVGEYGAILDGSNWSTSDSTQGAFRAHNQDIDYVTIRNLVIRKMPQKGIHMYYWMADHWTVENTEIAETKNGLLFASYSVIRNNYIHHNYGDPSSADPAMRGGGYGGYFATSTTVENNEIAYNGKEQKVMDSQSVTFRNNFVHHNQGDGIWYDGGNAGTVIEGNRVEDNPRNGIFYEASNGSIIRNNTIRRSGDTGVFISGSQNSEIYGNTLENNARGITYFIYCGALVRPEIDLANNWTHDNSIRVGTGSDVFATGMSYTSDCTPTQITTFHNGSKNLRFTHNTYYVPNVNGWYWYWNGSKQWSQWQAVPQDVDGTISQ